MEFGNQYIKTFANISAYNTFRSSEDFIRPNVSYCIQENRVFYSPTVVASLGQYLYSDLTVGTDAQPAGKIVIGVCVIPTGQLPDGKARFCSIKIMDYLNPDNGKTTFGDYIYWGGYGYDVPALKNYDQVVIKVDGTTTYGTSSWGYLPINSSSYADSSQNIPSILSDFENCTSTSIAPNNCLSDFDGKGNTAKIVAYDNSNSTSWQTASSLTNTYENQYIHPAAQCCWRYHTEGTNQGDWYLPSCGEFAFMIENRDLIANKIEAAGGPSASAINGAWYWSSTDCDSYYARILNLGNGNVYNGDKGDNYSVFAFLAF